MAEDGDTHHAMYEAGASANMSFRRGGRPNHPEAQAHHLNPSPSVPGAFHGFPVINLTEDSDDDLREIAPSQPPRQPRESAPVIDLTGLLDSPPEPQYRDGTTSRRARISRLPPWLASGIFSNNSDHGRDRSTDTFDRRSASWRRTNPTIPTIRAIPSLGSAARSQARDAFPPPTRVGFTRDTCADPEKESENVAICPACCNELAYDPYDTMLHSPGNTSKRKRKRAPEGRRFWALKNCGYVYCADCYNTRKPAKIKRNGADSRALDERSPYLVAADFGCDVEDCNTRASTEDDWVAIYL
ncbi:hypothetical protein FOXG_14154 [Fusarium oxysporum f. sp. lycopersici 4287]|uniref:Cell cycle control protein n=1 Tax=Fusarium oxysporum f. sp. lycopersici (strain 4287 / CBS 123668 / FGSC 9935 / NRRL 34936) TaxID=426428 RepID=A0A0J9VYB2_FUSO4|nr:hypothetical protein FOXG_14154 [Fusarium oxysporum f. sp. lycopersici 4287]KAJ9413499.1 hypothetical protein QL093DRAFT_2048733 [Fusarium oxysporum]KNB15741.1 hypothetical protein FOXG_14154 [Fusarium oxysporum f. sp. lycopersici 4287]